MIRDRRQRDTRSRLCETSRSDLITLLAAVLVAMSSPSAVEAQFSDPCEVRCGVLLGVSSYAVATAGMVAVGRATGGISGTDAAWIWTAGFAATFGTAVALSGDGRRQERAAHGAGIGLAAGALGGLVIGSVLPDSDPAYRISATLIGAGAGALLGGAIGALTYDTPTISLNLLSIQLPL